MKLKSQYEDKILKLIEIKFKKEGVAKLSHNVQNQNHKENY